MQSINVIPGVPNTKPSMVRSFESDSNYPLFQQNHLRIQGNTRDSSGNTLANCTVELFETATNLFRGSMVSDSVGDFAFWATAGMQFFLVGYKAGSPDVAGTTVNTIVGVEPSSTLTAPIVYLLHENFETATTGYDSGFSWQETVGSGGGAINHANTSSPLTGAQDLKLTGGSTGNPTKDLVDLGATYPEIWVYFQLMIDTGPAIADDICIMLRDSGQSEQASLYIRFPGNGSVFKFLSNASSGGSTVSTWSTATKYHIWLHYKNDGTGDIGFSTNGIRPTTGNNFAAYTGGNTNAIEFIELRAEESCVLQFDRVLVNNSQIGDNP